MAKKKTAAAEPQPTAQFEELVTRLREQVERLSEDKASLEERLAATIERKKRPARKFETEKIRVNGFVITVGGKDCTEDDAWIERVGDVVVILTGRAAEAKRNGDAVGVTTALHGAAAQVTRPDGGSWTNLTAAMGALPVGLGPSPNVPAEERARLMAINPLEQMERSIVDSGGRGIQ